MFFVVKRLGGGVVRVGWGLGGSGGQRARSGLSAREQVRMVPGIYKVSPLRPGALHLLPFPEAPSYPPWVV